MAVGGGSIHSRHGEVGDFNDDGELDFAATHEGLDQISVAVGFGLSAFSAPIAGTVGDGPTQIAVADFDGDGRDDVATVNANANTISVLLSRP
jgi:hypothetical protein